MNFTDNCPNEHNAPINSPVELYERTHEAHASTDSNAEGARNFETGLDSFPGLLPA